MRSYILAFVCLLTGGISAHADALKEAVAQDYAYLESLYQHLHANPELSFKEEQTAARLVKEMKELGFTVTEKVGGHGFVSVLENGDGPTVMVRTDLDALPVEERTGLPYASKIKSVEQTGQEVSVMHACGHDVHMTVWTGTARRLVALKDQWQGTLVMIGQPAEERGAGAAAMLKDGLFERFPRPDYNLAWHVNPSLAAGMVSYKPEFSYANVDSVDIHVKGIGGHGAYPHTTKDPVVIGSQIVLALQTIASREIAAQVPVVVTVGAFNAGAKHNVISDGAHLQLTVRTYSDETRNKVLSSIERIAHNTARVAGLPEDMLPEVVLKDEYTPAGYNNPALTERIATLLKESLGDEKVVLGQAVMGGEDFARYGRAEPRIPSLMLSLGSVSADKYAAFLKGDLRLPSLHSSVYAPDPEPTISTGVYAMTLAVLDLMGEE